MLLFPYTLSTKTTKMMANKATSQKTIAQQRQSLLFMVAAGIVLGTIGSLVNRAWASVVGTAVLLGVFGAYNNVLKRNSGIISGLMAGGLIGLVMALLSVAWGGAIESVTHGALFGLLRGLAVGIVVGLLTKAPADTEDAWYTRLFLIFGSIGVGALLGGGVGFVAGAVLGLIFYVPGGAILSLLLGSLIGGYLGTYYRSQRTILIGAGSGLILAAISILFRGALAGIVLGALAGALAPMLLVASIGAYGGLTSRGFKAMLTEAAEAPAEMIQQGAVPFLAPAMLIGLIVGAAAAGIDGILALIISLALIGIMLGVLGELEGRPNNKVTVGKMIEMVIIGSDDWPVAEVKNQMIGSRQKTAVTGAMVGVTLGLISATLGIILGQILLLLVQNILLSP